MSDVARGTPVLVHEPGIRPWRGTWQAIKPPRKFSKKLKNGKPVELAQWVDVRRPDGIEIVVPLAYVEVIVQDNVEVYGDDAANEPDDEERDRRYYGEERDLSEMAEWRA